MSDHQQAESDGADSGPQLDSVPEPDVLPSTAQNVAFGRLIPPQQQILTYSAEDWEQFILEWVHSQMQAYASVRRFAGPGDMGIDVAGMTDDSGLRGIWDNYQCKHYDHPLRPSDATKEVAKLLWHSYQGRYRPPREYCFIAPQGSGTRLTHLLGSPDELRKYLTDNWDTQCRTSITDRQPVELAGEFLAYATGFDFSIFSSRSPLEILDDHRRTPYHAVRFGGGLGPRPRPADPPQTPTVSEQRYIEQLLQAYGDHLGRAVTTTGDLGDRSDLEQHYCRQREYFYHAEALRNFARDTVPTGTYEDLQDEVYDGVVDVEASDAHADGYARLNAVTQASAELQLTSSPLISVVRVPDRKGMCHQLANDNRLTWRKP